MTGSDRGGIDSCWRDIEYLNSKIKTQTTWMRWSIGGLTSVVIAMGMWGLQTQATRFYAADGQALRAELVIEIRTLQSRMKQAELEIAKIPGEIPPPWFASIVYQNSSDLKALKDDVGEIKTLLREHAATHDPSARN